MLRKIYQELVAIRKELQAMNKNLGPKMYYLETRLEQIKEEGSAPSVNMPIGR